MYIINGYQSKGVIEENGLPYDNMVFTCFADSWPDKIGLNDTTYFRFGQPTKIVKVPVGVLVAVLGIPFVLGDDSRDIVRKYDFENKLVGSEFLPVYNEKGKVVNCSFSFVEAGVKETADVPADMVDKIEISDSKPVDSSNNKKK